MEPEPPLDPDRVQEAFAEAADLPTLSRGAFLARLHSQDPTLASEVSSLLGYHAESQTTEVKPFSASPATLVGSTIAGCNIDGLLGYGGMSAVYSATQDFPRRRVAVKVVRRERLSASARRRLRVEAEALARLDHPNIARVYAAGSQRMGEDERESPYIVMELIENALPLTEWSNRQQLTARARILLIATIADAVEHAHRAGVIHRDLKPGNVIVGNDGAPKVIDFGIAAVRDSTVTAATEGPMGTLAYMSPEQARGRTIDTRSDVWGLGALLYDLLSDHPPFDGGDPSIAAHLEHLLHGTAQPIAPLAAAAHGPAFAASLPAATDAVLHKALASEPDRRYRSALEFADELRRVLAGETLIAQPDSEWDAFVRVTRKHRARLVTALGVFLVVACALIVSLVLLRREGQEHDRADWAAYVASLSAASAMLDRGDASAAHDMLLQAPPALRGWEWHALERAIDQTVWEVAYAVGQQVYCVDWSLDSTRIAVAASGSISVLDAERRRELWRTPEPNLLPAWRVIMMANGDTIALYHDGTLRRFNASGSVVAQGLIKASSDLASNAARTRLFAEELGGAQEIDPSTLERIGGFAAQPPLTGAVGAVAVTADARHFLVGTMDGEVTALRRYYGARLWSFTAERRNSGQTGDQIRAVAISPDDRVAVAVCLAGVFAFELASGERLWHLPGVESNYRGVKFSSDGREVIASAWAESVDRLDATTGAHLATIAGAYSQVWHSAPSPDGKWIASGTFSAHVKVFDSHASSRAEEFACDGSAILTVSQHKDRIYATTANGGLFALSTERGSTPVLLASSLHANAVYALPSGELAVAHDGGVAWLSSDGSILRSVETASPATRVGSLDRGATTTVRLEDEQMLALSTADGSVVWSTHHFKRGSTVALETARRNEVVLPRGVTGLSGLLDTSSMEERALVREIEYASCGALSPDRKLVAIGSVARASELAIVDARTYQLVAQLPNHRRPVHAIAWSPDNLRVASASTDGTVRVWDVANKQEVLTAWRGSCRDLAWDSEHTLWLACDDGLLRALRVTPWQ